MASLTIKTFIKNMIKNNGAQVKIATKTIANLYMDMIGSMELSNFYYHPLLHVNKSFIQLIIPVNRHAMNILLIIDFYYYKGNTFNYILVPHL